MERSLPWVPADRPEAGRGFPLTSLSVPPAGSRRPSTRAFSFLRRQPVCLGGCGAPSLRGIHTAVEGRHGRRRAARERRRLRGSQPACVVPAFPEIRWVGLRKPVASDLVRRKEVGNSRSYARERGLPFSLYRRSLAPQKLDLGRLLGPQVTPGPNGGQIGRFWPA